MKKQIILLAVVFLSVLSISGFAQDKGYKDGTVWAITFIKATTGMGDDYLKDLKNNWKAVQDEAVKQGLLVSYKILQGTSANPGDWDIMLMEEYKNMAALENADEKWMNISKSKIGNDEAMKKIMDSRVNMRTIYGSKLMREVIY